jgi:hypothetical protein
MKKKHMILGCMLAMALLFGSIGYAQKAAAHKAPGQKPPVENVNPKKHPNLAAAQRLLDQAFNKITAAQQANEFDLEGHAARAKELIDQASQQLKEAAEAANKEHKEHKEAK